MLRRQDIRKELGIKGDSCTDCLVSAFCGVCSVAQMNMEVKGRASKRRAQGGELPPGYSQEQERMVYEENLPLKTAQH